MDRKHPGPRGETRILGRLFAQLIAVVALFAIAVGIRYLPCWGLFVLAALGAWPLWAYGVEVALFERRLYLGQLTRAHSRLRRWFWTGRLTRIFHAVVAFFLALTLFVFAARLNPEQWLVLFIDVLLLSTLAEPLRRQLAQEVRKGQAGVTARRWPLPGMNLLGLTLAFSTLDFFAGAPDTRLLTWNQVAEQAYVAEGLGVVCVAIGWFIGALASVDALTWHAAQITTTAVPDSALRALTWVLVLAKAGVLAYLFTRLQLGVMSLIERRDSRGVKEDGLTRAFVFTILVLAIPYFYANLKLAQLDTTRLGAMAREVIALTDPCRLDPRVREKLVAALDGGLRETRQATREAAGTRIDDGVGELVADLEPAVDAYLDWYFTVLGEYERLAALVAGDFLQVMTDKFQVYIFEDSGFAQNLVALEQSTSTQSLHRLRHAAADLGARALNRVQPDACALGGLSLAELSSGLAEKRWAESYERDATRAATALGGGAVAAGASMKLLAKKAAASAASKAAATNTFQAAAGLAVKFGAKKGAGVLLTGATAAAACAPGGAAAIVCGVVAGVVAWVAIDKAAIEVDEQFNREALRNDIMQSLRTTAPEVAEALRQRQYSLIDASLRELEAGIERTFLPYRDGL